MAKRSFSYCTVDDCCVTTRDCVPFFRCPKDIESCQKWKESLGFIGEHKYAKLTPDECNSRIRVCSLHFDNNCFTSSGKRLLKTAVPSKVPKKLIGEIPGPSNVRTQESETSLTTHVDVSTQTINVQPCKLDVFTQTIDLQSSSEGLIESPLTSEASTQSQTYHEFMEGENNQSSETIISSKNIIDATTQTDIVYEDTKCQKCSESTKTKQTEKYIHTTRELSAETPIKLSVKRRIPCLEKEIEDEDSSFYHSNQPALYNVVETEMDSEIDNDEIEVKYQPFSLDQIKEEIDIDDYNSPSDTHQLKKRKISHQFSSRTESDTRIDNPIEDNQKDEWHYFGNNIACQLRNLPLERALMCQQKILDILTRDRIDFVTKIKTEETNTAKED